LTARSAHSRCSENAIEITPIDSSTAATDTRAASSQPTKMPTAAAGSIRISRPLSQVLRKLQTLTTSWMIRIGSRMAAASTGETTSDSMGAATTPIPANPPLARPSRITAGMATA
jgi:hypothetical protein